MRATQSISKPSSRTTDGVESAAISASLLCLVHCLALPILLLLLPSAAEAFVRSEAFHYVAVGLVTPFACIAFALGYIRHRALHPALFGAVGVACLVIALFPGITETLALWLTVGGSILLVVGHLINWRLRLHAV